MWHNDPRVSKGNYVDIVTLKLYLLYMTSMFCIFKSSNNIMKIVLVQWKMVSYWILHMIIRLVHNAILSEMLLNYRLIMHNCTAILYKFYLQEKSHFCKTYLTRWHQSCFIFRLILKMNTSDRNWRKNGMSSNITWWWTSSTIAAFGLDMENGQKTESYDGWDIEIIRSWCWLWN